MNFVFPVNQKQAIRRGFNTHSTFKYDLDVTSLTEPERYALSLAFDEHDWNLNPMMELAEPTAAGVREALAWFANELVKFRKELEDCLRNEDEDALARLRANSCTWQQEVLKEWEKRPDVKAWMDRLSA